MSFPSPLEVWGGVECTLNRVGDVYHDQLTWSGHYDRLEDLDRFASLGLKALRYPILWERWGDESDWSWLDVRLERLRTLGIRPILGLVHHGSGPAHTSLLDAAFAEGLAEFAERVARRYPWVQDYTPVNEPLTTARFSGLYGVWYPHRGDDRSFLRALVNQCRATLMAMERIRRVQPRARLIQTEDLAKIHSTPKLAYQAAFENERRWLGFDVLAGRLHRQHPLFRYLLDNGIGLDEIAWFQRHGRVPEVLGLNHYVTSERFLDEQVDRYPPHCRGGNGRHAYADVEAVRVGRADGPLRLIMECWERYRLPMALTEAHLGCTREEQLRWLRELWTAASQARAAGAEMLAVTTWALLGSYEWASLVTRPCGHYECGAFDVRSSPPRPTAVAHMVRALARGEEPTVHGSGWWTPRRDLSGPPLLITGGTGTLGRAFARICERRGLPFRLTTRRELDIADPASVARMLGEVKPWAVINAAGYVRVDEAEREPGACFRENFHGAALLGAACADRALPFLTFSSDLVFDGTLTRPYRESDLPRPLCVYGWSKRRAEEALADHALVVRTAAFFGPWDEHNFVAAVLRALRRGERFAASDTVVSPTYVCDLIDASLDLLLDGETGLWHLSNRGSVSWLELAREVARHAGEDPSAVEPADPARLGWIARRPAYSALESERGELLPALDSALARYFQETELLVPA